MSVRRTAVALAAAALLISGCSDDPEPRFEPPPSPSPSESETTAEPEAQSPEAFIREWFELNTEMQNTGETSAFLSASRNCTPCDDLAKRVERIYQRGGFVDIESQDVRDITPGSRSATIKQFDVVVFATPTRYREAAGGQMQSYAGGRADVQVTLVKYNDGWAMENLVGLE